MNSLILFGQLRTFKQCLPTILNYIDYYNKPFDVFLFIDKNNDKNYNEENMLHLNNILFSDRIKIIKYTDQMSQDEIKCENDLINKYNKTSQNIKKYFNLSSITTNNFVTKLYYRRYLLLTYVSDYCQQNNVHYDNCILTRFDIKLSDEKYMFYEKKNTNDLSIIFDILFSGNLLTLLKIFQFSFEYFAMYDICLTKNKESLNNILNNIHNKVLDENELNKIYKNWLCMPEMNFNVYLIKNNIKFTKIICNNAIQR